MNINELSVDIFFHYLTYLSSSDIISLCSCNRKFYNYGTNSRFGVRWKFLIDKTYGDIYDYSSLLSQIQDQVRSDLGSEHIKTEPNYLVYTQLIDLLDPISQLMIDYRQNDLLSFNDSKFTHNQRFLALCLLNRRYKIEDWLPGSKYSQFIDIMDGKSISSYDFEWMVKKLAKQGNVKGLMWLKERGADLHYDSDAAFISAVENGRLSAVKFLTEQGADINLNNGLALHIASKDGDLPIVRFLTEQGADIHIDHDFALGWASDNNRLEVVKYLVEHGTDIHEVDDRALRWASSCGHLSVVKYLLEQGANIHAQNEHALRWASLRGHLEIVKYLVEQGADIHANDDEALRWAQRSNNEAVVEYLESLP